MCYGWVEVPKVTRRDPPLPIAHRDRLDGREHDLADHLRAVGELAASFAARFGSGGWGRATGCWHDLGKYRPAFQRMIRSDGGERAHLEDEQASRVDHSSPGAVHAERLFGRDGRPVALAIAGHHTGLRNQADWVERRLPATGPLLGEVDLSAIPTDLVALPAPPRPPFLDPGPALPPERRRSVGASRTELWIRMLFSSLVDADFLDTEEFFQPRRSDSRGEFPSLAELGGRLLQYLGALAQSAPHTIVNQIRSEVLDRARRSAREPQGVWSLTVPTGGGKTYAALAFSFEHALVHGLERVIVVAPYLTIIDQTAQMYRAALALEGEPPPFVEHHSGVEPQQETEKNRLATENWDAPLIITTAVQFFESLFARRTSQCRKLHNLARSVIVLDEVQTLPGDLLAPILDILQQLVDHYSVTLVLSTATQPELRERTNPEGRHVPGFREIREINDPFDRSFARLRRVRVERVATTSWDELAQLVIREPRALVITHLRKDAYELAMRLQVHAAEQPLYHLSALMCARHRQERIAEIRKALEGGSHIRVVSTQLVEAGVDLDFPVVFRAMAGFDALAQSAGRCNREGRLDFGRLVIFDAPTRPPVGPLRTAADLATALLRVSPEMDVLDPTVYRDFDRRLDRIRDRRGIQGLREQLAFEDVASAFSLIDGQWQQAVVVPYGEAPVLLTRAEVTEDPRALRQIARLLQPYTVSIATRLARTWHAAGALREVAGLFLTLSPGKEKLYDAEFGLLVAQTSPAADPADLIA
jgi:CRISPR-associated endonuclease/helicase Cas3